MTFSTLCITSLLASALFLSCSKKQESKTSQPELVVEDSIPSSIPQIQPIVQQESIEELPVIRTLNDTIIEFFIDGISSEGTGAIVHYSKGIIKYADIIICGDAGKAEITYTFDNDEISVHEKSYMYNVLLVDVKSSEDMTLEHDISYKMNLSGEIISNTSDIRVSNIFEEFKKTVPFKLYD